MRFYQLELLPEEEGIKTGTRGSVTRLELLPEEEVTQDVIQTLNSDQTLNYCPEEGRH